ncbi:MAG: Pr6Pr family membrane protein [Microbacteriaceae bacterium]
MSTTAPSASAPPASAPVSPSRISRARRVTGVVRLIVGLGVLGAITYQIIDLSIHDAFTPEQYFTFFTIQTCLMAGVVLTLGGVFALRRAVDPRPHAVFAAAIVPFAVITGIVYNLLLRDGIGPGYQGSQIPNEIMHVVVPIVVALDWLLAPGRPRVPWRTLLIAAAYPLAWLAFTMIRGGIDGWYPYPFVDPTGPDGTTGVLIYTVVLTTVILLIATGAIALTHRRRRAG